MNKHLRFIPIVFISVLLFIAFISAINLTAGGPVLARPAAPDAGIFYDSGQQLGNLTSHAVALGDLDGDGDLDAFIANAGANQVWLNTGFARFSDSGQRLGSFTSSDVGLVDLDNDADLDAIVANENGPDQVWLNNGIGVFSAGQAFGSGVSRGLALGDIDGDTDPDIVVARAGGNTVWINTGGTLTDTLQSLGTASSSAVALGDLDGDTDVDAFFANGTSSNNANTVWINQGGAQAGTEGLFLDSGQTLAFAWTEDAALDELDITPGLDAFTANFFPVGNKVWANDGSGTFSDTGQSPGLSASLSVALGDLDGDNDLDAFVTTVNPDANQVWLNDGNGAFSDSGQALDPNKESWDAALGDLDGDGDLDIFTANFGPNTVWINGDAGLPAAFFDVAREINDQGDDVYYQANSGDALLPVLLAYPYTSTLAVHARIATAGGVMTETIPYSTGQQVRFLNIVNPLPDPSETYTLTLSITPPAVLPGPADVTDQLVMAFIDGDQGMVDCFLCYVEWLGRFVGIDPGFGLMHHLALEDQRASPLWLYYTGLFDYYAPEMAEIAATNPGVLWQSLAVLEEWTPLVQSLNDGSGGTITVTQQMAADLDNLAAGLEEHAGPALSAAIQHEQTALDLPSLEGMTVDEVWEAFETRRPIEDFFITIIIKP